MSDERPSAPSAPEPAAPTPPPLDVSEQADKRRRWIRLGWAVGVGVALVATVVLAGQVKSFTVPFLTAFILAYLLDPLVDRIEARGVARTAAIGVLLLFIVGGGAVLFVLVVPQVVREFALIPAKLVALVEQLRPWAAETLGIDLPTNIGELFGGLETAMGEQDARSFLGPAKGLVKTVFGGTASLLSSIIGAFMIPVFAFFLLRDFDDIVDHARELVPRDYRTFVVARFREIDEAMGSFVRGQLTVSAVLTVLYAIGFAVVGLPLALPVAIIAGVGNLVPYLGTTIGLLLAVVALAIDWTSWGHAAACFGVFGVVQVLEGWLITPRIVGDSVGLSTLAVIVAVLVFSELFGFYGVLLAIPLAAILKILGRVVLDQYRASDFFEGDGQPDP